MRWCWWSVPRSPEVQAWQELCRRVRTDMDAGEGLIRPPHIVFRRANPKRIAIHPFQARLLRMKQR